MKIGIIGLGGIARKAYLPIVLNKGDLTPVLCTRNSEILNTIAGKYRIADVTTSIDGLIDKNIQAAFVHTSTESHFEIVKKLLLNDINVYVDKPISYYYSEARELVDLAEKRGKHLFVGFNRRFCPAYAGLNNTGTPGIVLVQKNRTYLPEEIRSFIFDDFIHVVDTIRFLSPELDDKITVTSNLQDSKLIHVTVQFTSNNFTAFGMMNRNNGTTEEVVEIMKDGEKYVVNDMDSTRHFCKGEERINRFNVWDPVLYRRGFVDLINHFLEVIRGNANPLITSHDALLTHKYCEDIVARIERSAAP